MIEEDTEQKEGVISGYMSRTRRKLLSSSDIITGYFKGVRTLYIIIKLVGFLQVLSFSINIHNSNNFDATGYSYFKKFLEYTTLTEFPSLSAGLLLGLLIASISISISAILSYILVVVFYRDTSKSSSSTATKIYFTIISFYIMIFDSILLIPFVQISSVSTVCSIGVSEYQSTIISPRLALP